MQRIEFLSKIPMFSSLSDTQLELLASLIKERKYKEGHFIVKDKDILDTLCLLSSGSVKLTKYSPSGKEQIEHIFVPGEMMGLCTLFTNNLFPANAIALEDSTIYLLSKKELEKIAYKEQALLLNLVFALSARLAESMSMVESLSLQKVPQRLASFLIYSLYMNNNTNTIQLPFNHLELSRMLGTTPETLSRAFTHFKKIGILKMEGSQIIIEDIKKLTAIAEEL
jgi:CRP/FNR family transcriptional regulator